MTLQENGENQEGKKLGRNQEKGVGKVQTDLFDTLESVGADLDLKKGVKLISLGNIQDIGGYILSEEEEKLFNETLKNLDGVSSEFKANLLARLNADKKVEVEKLANAVQESMKRVQELTAGRKFDKSALDDDVSLEQLEKAAKEFDEAKAALLEVYSNLPK